MTDPVAPDRSEELPTNRRDLLKGVFFGGITGAESRVDAVKALLVGQSAATDDRTESERTGVASQTNSSWNPIPVRATEKVSVREIVENTANASGPSYQLTEVAEKRGLLGVSHPDNPREDPPFALRELITSQAITSAGIKNKTIGSDSGWTNWVGDFGSGDQLTKFKPEEKRELVEAIIKNARGNATIRAVGAGHSHSKAAVPEENFIELSWYDDEVKGLVDKCRIRWQRAARNRVRVEAGAPIRYLARKLLLEDDKALLNRGSFDAQTLAGAINTSTHGTGAELGAISDAVVSVDLATVVESPAQDDRPLVRLFRVEPTNGVTDRRRFEADVGTHETTLIQDDDVFHSVVVGYGCMGVAYAYTIDVRENYWLWENTANTKWSKIKGNIDTLREPPSNYNSHPEAFDPTDSSEGGSRHFQFQVNLSMAQVKTKSDPRCLVISHREPHKYTTKPTYDQWPELPRSYGTWKGDNWPPERTGKSGLRKFFEKNVGRSFHPAKAPVNSSVGINKNFQTNANNPPFEGQNSRLESNHIPDGYWSASFVALKRPKEHDPDPPWDDEPRKPPLAISTEIAVPADQVGKAVEAVMERANNHRLTFHVPMGVRFVARTEHFLSPEYQGDNEPEGPVATLEVPYAVEPWKSTAKVMVPAEDGPGLQQQPLRTIPKADMLDYAKTALAAIEDKLVTMSENGELGFARPHMGKTNTIGKPNGSGNLGDFYDQFETWQTVHEAFDPFGTFNNEFTETKGISIERE